MKIKFSVIFVLMLMASICVTYIPVEAMETDRVTALAYMSTEGVSAQVKEQIVEARMEIICSKSWVADGVTGRVLDEDGNVLEVLPHFSEIFPADWEKPNFGVQADTPINGIQEGNLSALRAENEIHKFYDGDLYLRNPSPTFNSPSFCSFETSSSTPAYHFEIEQVYTTGYYYFPSGVGTYNVGYSNARTGESLGLKTRIDSGHTVSIDTPSGITVAVRASTYDAVGTWQMVVTGAGPATRI